MLTGLCGRTAVGDVGQCNMRKDCGDRAVLDVGIQACCAIYRLAVVVERSPGASMLSYSGCLKALSSWNNCMHVLTPVTSDTGPMLSLPGQLFQPDASVIMKKFGARLRSLVAAK